MDTVAIPQTLHLRPIQLTPVPVKLNVAVAPAISELPAAPLLKAAISAPRNTQAPAGPALTAGLSSSTRVAAVAPAVPGAADAAADTHRAAVGGVALSPPP